MDTLINIGALLLVFFMGVVIWDIIPGTKKNSDPFKKPFLIRLWKWMQMWDAWLYTGPILTAIFIGVGIAGQAIFKTEEGSAFGFYDPSALHRALLAGVIHTLLNGLVLFFGYMNRRGYYRYFYRNRPGSGSASVKDDFTSISPLHRILIYHGVNGFQVVVYLIIFWLI